LVSIEKKGIDIPKLKLIQNQLKNIIQYRKNDATPNDMILDFYTQQDSTSLKKNFAIFDLLYMGLVLALSSWPNGISFPSRRKGKGHFKLLK